MSAAYSFLNALAGYSDDLGFLIDLSAGNGIAEEGIVVAFADDKVSITYGADGDFMYSLHAASGGMVTVNVLKTSPLNNALSRLYLATTGSSARTGRGTIAGGDPQRGDSFTAIGCQIRKHPDTRSAKEGGTNEWVFMVGKLSVKLGSGDPALAINRGV